MNDTAQETHHDRAIDFRTVNSLIGSQCKTSHTARRLAERGLIRPIRFNDRVIRYSERSVLDLLSQGGVQ